MSTGWVALRKWTNPLPMLPFRPSGLFHPTVQSRSCFVNNTAASYSNWALKSVAEADPVVVAADGNYGRKQVISVTPQLYDYMLANVREPQILRELREETAAMRGSQMQVSPDQAQLLAMLVQILGAERCIEVGVYTGYSSLAVALALPSGGRLVACERDARSLEVAKRYYDRAGVSQKVAVKHGVAADTLKSMIEDGESFSYDFAFVDAEKRMYSDYFELLLQLVRVGGVIVIDNVLWHGKVADPLVNDLKTVSIRNFNKKLMDDDRVSISMVGVSVTNAEALWTKLESLSVVKLICYKRWDNFYHHSADVAERARTYWDNLSDVEHHVARYISAGRIKIVPVLGT